MKTAEPKHWFLLSYMVQQPGMWAPHSIVVGSETLELTLPQLINLRNAYGVPEASILMAISPLGWMTEKAINGKPDIDPPTVISEAYRQGMLAATKVAVTDPRQPLNPYSLSSESPQEMADAEEWQQGFFEVRKAQADNVTSIKRFEPPPEAKQTGETASGEVKPESLRKPPK